MFAANRATVIESNTRKSINISPSQNVVLIYFDK